MPRAMNRISKRNGTLAMYELARATKIDSPMKTLSAIPDPYNAHEPIQRGTGGRVAEPENPQVHRKQHADDDRDTERVKRQHQRPADG